MSEYTPITGELRTAMRQWGWVETDGSITFTSSSMPPSIDAEQFLAISDGTFDRLCDAIDAVHRGLEDENERLRRENESLKAELDRVLGEQDNCAIMLTPKDMNDEPIHIGDVMQMDGDSELREVVGFYKEGFFAWLNGRFVPCTANLYRHHQPDTWERIIADALGCEPHEVEQDDDLMDLVARCKALCERTKGGDAE